MGRNKSEKYYKKNTCESSTLSNKNNLNNVMNMKDERLLHEYQDLIKKIKALLIEDSVSSIQSLFFSLNWDDTVYRTFNYGIYLMWKENKQDKLPGTIIEYIHKAHLSLILAILRKLFEPPKRGKHSVNSIPTIINIIKSNIGYWTRENYVCYDGTPYCEDESADWRVKMIIKNRHDRFDRMCEFKKGRSRKDKLSPLIIESFERKALLNKDIEKFVNNFLFHAALSNSRPNEDDAYNKITLLKIQAQIRRSVWIVLQIGKIVDQLVLTELATPQFDQFNAWENSFFDKKIRIKLEIYWDKRSDWWRKWTNVYWYSDDIYLSPNKIYKGNNVKVI